MLEIGILLVTGYLRPRPDPWAYSTTQVVAMDPWVYRMPCAVTLVLCCRPVFRVFAHWAGWPQSGLLAIAVGVVIVNIASGGAVSLVTTLVMRRPITNQQKR